MSETKEFNIEFLDLNRHRFKYGFLSGHKDENQRAIRIYIAFRAMLLIDQLHDFLQKGEDRNKLFEKNKKDDTSVTPDEYAASKNVNEERQKNLYNNMVSSMFKGIDEFMTKVLKTPTKMIDMETKNNTEDTVYSLYFMQEINFFSLFIRYFDVNERTYIATDKIGILTGEHKYKIVDEILYRIFDNKVINIEDLYIQNNVVYDCSNNFNFIENLTKENYNKRYSTAATTDKMSITVDADKSKYGTSEIAKQACIKRTKNVEYIKTNGTLYDAASATSTTESILNLIKMGTDKIKSKYSDLDQNIEKNMKNIYKNVRYNVKLLGEDIVSFSYDYTSPTDDSFANSFVDLVKFFEFKKNITKTELENEIKNLYETKTNLVDNLVQYTKVIDTNVRNFIKSYKFGEDENDEPKYLFDGKTLNLELFMSLPPYNINKFIFRKLETFTKDTFVTVFSGLYMLYHNNSNKITLKAFMEEIFPGYRPKIVLNIYKFFELRNPTNYNILNKTLFNTIKTGTIPIYVKETFDSIDENEITEFFKFVEDRIFNFASKTKNIKNRIELQNDINANSEAKVLLSNKYICTNTKNYKLLFECAQRLNKYIIDNFKSSGENVIDQVFKINERQFNQENSSVGDITEYIVKNYKDKDLFKTERDILYFMAHKTLGDFGQVVAFYTVDNLNTANQTASFGSKRGITETNSGKNDGRKRQRTPINKEQLEMIKKELEGYKYPLIKETASHVTGSYNKMLERGAIVPTNKLKFFVTFDRVCARISSLFNHGTVFENAGFTLSPMELFDTVSIGHSAIDLVEAGLLVDLSNQIVTLDKMDISAANTLIGLSSGN